jgi:hypothetical protein
VVIPTYFATRPEKGPEVQSGEGSKVDRETKLGNFSPRRHCCTNGEKETKGRADETIFLVQIN